MKPADQTRLLRYARILNLGMEEGHPVLTFTAVGPDARITPAEPSREYVQTIARGIREAFTDVRMDQLCEYFEDCDGVRGKIPKESLRGWLSAI
jgi:hypothetical protein